jgi:hypothetical protein
MKVTLDQETIKNILYVDQPSLYGQNTTLTHIFMDSHKNVPYIEKYCTQKCYTDISS